MNDIDRAAALLRAGQLVAFPTETVYGLGADASQPEAVARIFAAKGRPADHPVIVHLPDAGQMTAWAREIPPAARDLAAAFWPGPLTLILPRRPTVSDAITGGQDTVGLRVPGHPVALALLRAFGSGIAAPSANRFGRISPTTAAHVQEELGDAVACILDGGPCQVGIESTIVDLSRGAPRILRPGAISAADVARVAGISPDTPTSAAPTSAPRVSGALAAHYAPMTPMRLVAAAQLEAEAMALTATGKRIAVLAYRPAPAGLDCIWRLAAGDPAGYAQGLYAHLRDLDHLGADLLLVEAPPDDAAWTAIHDRLGRAVHGAGR